MLSGTVPFSGGTPGEIFPAVLPGKPGGRYSYCIRVDSDFLMRHAARARVYQSRAPSCMHIYLHVYVYGCMFTNYLMHAKRD